MVWFKSFQKHQIWSRCCPYHTLSISADCQDDRPMGPPYWQNLIWPPSMANITSSFGTKFDTNMNYTSLLWFFGVGEPNNDVISMILGTLRPLWCDEVYCEVESWLIRALKQKCTKFFHVIRSDPDVAHIILFIFWLAHIRLVVISYQCSIGAAPMETDDPWAVAKHYYFLLFTVPEIIKILAQPRWPGTSKTCL